MLQITTDKNQLDLDFIYQFLRNSYWANKRTKEEINTSIANSLCFGMYLDNKQIGFARVVTDKVAFSYIMDVFIAKNHQGKKYGEKLISEIYKHPDLIPVEKHFLLTKDAQNFYRKFGFEEFPTPEKFMIRGSK